MSQAYSCGPADIFLGVGSASKTPVFLGWSEGQPDIDITAEYVPVKSDKAGPVVPIDTCYVGEWAQVTVDLTRWNEPIMAFVESWPAAPFRGVRGTDAAGARGTLLQTEGVDYPVIVRFPYSVKTAYATLPAGYRFYSGRGQNLRIKPGTGPMKKRIVFYCLPVLNIKTGQFALYDHVMTGLPPVD